MSWDIFVMDFPSDIKTVRDIPKDFQPPPIGKRSDIIMKIKEIVPFADFTNPSWGQIDGKGFSIEVSLSGDEEILDGFVLYVRGGDEAVGVIADILDNLGLRALDGSNEETGFFDPQKSVEGLRRWRAYRDQIINASRGDT
jgi:hypothetical protein